MPEKKDQKPGGLTLGTSIGVGIGAAELSGLPNIGYRRKDTGARGRRRVL